MQLGSTNSVDTTTLLGLTRYYANTIANINGFTDAQITAFLNQAQRKLQTFILSEVMHDWRENTLNGTGNGSIALVSNQNNYSFPTNLITIDQVEINYTGDTNGYRLATPFLLGEINEAINNTAEFNSIRGSYINPIYWVREGTIYVDPIPDQAVTGGLKVYGTTKVTDLSSSGDEPVFVESFQEILCMDAAIKYLLAKGYDQLAASVKSEMNELKFAMVKFYTNRFTDKKRVIKAKKRNYR